MAVELHIRFHRELAAIDADAVRPMVPKLERRGDLAEHATERTDIDVGLTRTRRMRALLAQLGSRCVTMSGTGLTTAVP